MDANPIPSGPDPRLWRRHLISLQVAAMRDDPSLDPAGARKATLGRVLASARSRYPADFAKIAAALGAA